MTKDEVFAKLKEILQNDFAIPAEKITQTATFRGTLGMDSLDTVDLVFFIEKSFGLKEGLHAYRELHSVEKLITFLLEKKRVA